jgi:2-dehydro-3-deoxyphosphogluconate aldolase/(4S)-4-hydroxy-2-oxoglutarate aldolase
MAKYSRLKVLTSMVRVGMVPVFYHADVEVAASVVKACADGGVCCFEFTNRGDLAHEVFRELVLRFKNDDRVILGAGSVIDAGTAALYLQLGANFIVGPCFNAEVARICNRRQVAYCPGCGSVTEISNAQEMGVEICKVFPGSAVGGPSFVKDLLAPLPWSRIMPTGGVDTTSESINSWFKAGVACVGMGSKLFPAEGIKSGDYSAITTKVKDVLAIIEAVRPQSSINF